MKAASGKRTLPSSFVISPSSSSSSELSKRTLETHPQSSVLESQESAIDWDEMVSATSTRNYLLNDPLLDWLKQYSSQLSYHHPDLSPTIIKATSHKSSTNFIEFIMEQGREFEVKVMSYFYAKYGGENITDVGGELCAKSQQKVQDTIDAMNRGVPIIHSGVLHDYANKTYGIPDLLVRSDWLNRIFEEPAIEDAKVHRPATFLKSVVDPSIPPKYHYRVIDIKFTTLYLRADGVHILNTGSFPAYKGQLWIYNEALARVQGYRPDRCYIMGRKWTYTTCGNTYKGNSCTQRLGVIDFANVDKEMVEKTKKAIMWIQDMRKNGSQWDIFNFPLVKGELYPNMSNYYDYPWRQVKEHIAEKTKEITDLWMCGIKQREEAHKHAIYRWTDTRLTPEIMGIRKETVTAQILSKMISINRDSKLFNIEPQYIQRNDCGWTTPKKVEFFVDFEMTNDVFSDFSQLPFVESFPIVFMIGVGYIEPQLKTWIYKSFIVNEFSKHEERRIAKEFSAYILETSEWYDVKEPLLVHWSHAERTQWNAVTERHPSISDLLQTATHEEVCTKLKDARWFDMLKLFKSEPIVLKGCLSFGLKEVAKTMLKHGMITTDWDKDNSCTDGTDAMLGAYRAAKDAKARGLSLRDMPQIKDIEKYNEIDCKVLEDIISYLRKNHVAPQINFGDVTL